MNAFEALNLFRQQIARRTGLKVVLVPSPVKDAAPTVRIAVKKILATTRTIGTRHDPATEIRVGVALDGKVESETGLRLAVEACQALAAWLATVRRLEDGTGAPMADHSVTSQADVEDGILEDPENDMVAWIRDEHVVTISIPGERSDT